MLLVITPRLRPAVLALLTAREKATLSCIVGAMLAYGLSYRQTHEDGAHDYVLQPALGSLALNPPLEGPPLAASVNYGIKQV